MHSPLARHLILPITILVCVFPTSDRGSTGGNLGRSTQWRHPLLDTGIALNYRDSTMAQPNFKNRTLWTGDNLDIMRGLNSETIDLIYLDPPFNSNKTYSAPIGSEAAGAAFKDTWTLSDVDLAWHGEIAEANPSLYRVIDTAREAHGKGMQSYLIMMAVRLLEMHRLLKPTGSIYLHCDPTASHYLKLLMDAVFGANNFGSEITWKRTSAHSDTRQGRRQHGRIRDLLLFYTKTDDWIWNPVYTPYDPQYVANFYKHIEPETNRKFRLDNLTGPGGAAKGNPHYELMGVTRYWRYSEERMKQLVKEGRVIQTKPGTVPQYKRYLDEMPGVPLQDLWTDIRPIQSKSKERRNYPTQKPLALLERIIRSSSNEGDVVIDPFCGCATALVAAEKLQRQWVGIDLSPQAQLLIKSRLGKELGLFSVGTVYRDDVPQRTDMGKLPHYTTHKNPLYGRQEGHCAGCNGFFEIRNFTVDHIVAKSKGGTDHLDNLQLLCSACNSTKGTKTQTEFLAELKRQGIR